MLIRNFRLHHLALAALLLGSPALAADPAPAAPAPAPNDEVLLIDGSKIVGHVVGLAAGKLTIHTDFAGDIVIDAAKVQGITTPGARSVQLKSGDTVVGPLKFDPATKQESVESPVAKAPNVPVAQVAAVYNPGEKSPDVIAAEPKWSAKIEVGLTGQTGNSENVSFLAAGEINRVTLTDRFKLYTLDHYEKSNGSTSAQQFLGGASYEADINDNLYWYVKTEGEKNVVESLKFRSTTTAGLGDFLVKKDDLIFKVHGGVGFQHESFDNGESNNSAVLELGEDLKLKVAPWLLFIHDITYTPTFDDFGDYRLVMDNAGEIPLNPSQTWKIKLGLRNQYRSKPQNGSERLDSFYFLNLVYEFK